MPQFVGPDGSPDKYRLVDLVGAGGEAELWRAEVTLAGHGETVAVKVLRPEHVADFAKLSQRWAEQAELLRFVTHPHVVGVREHFEGAPRHEHGEQSTERDLYLVMNWVEGETLRDRVLRRPRAQATASDLRILEQVGGVLDLLHTGGATPSRRAIVHGDLSPANVMVTRNGVAEHLDRTERAVLVDFGLVRLVGHHTRVAAGTPGYAAPEVWTHGEYSPATDRYAFAALTVLTLTGEKPSPDPDTTRAALAASPLVAEPRDVEIIMAGLDPDPRRRPGPRELLTAVGGPAERTVLGEVPTTRDEIPTVAEALPSRRRALWLAAATLAVAAAGVIIFLVAGRAPSPGATVAAPASTAPAASAQAAATAPPSTSAMGVPGLAPVGFDTTGALVLRETARGTRVRVPVNSSIDLDSAAADWGVVPIAASDQGTGAVTPGTYDLFWRGLLDAVEPVSGAPRPTLEGARIYSDPRALSFAACSAAPAYQFGDSTSPATDGTMCVRTDQEHLAAVRVASFTPTEVDLEIVAWA